jgi:transcriptional regulator with XRE-family HTH domain
LESIKRRRKALGISLNELARRTGLFRETLAKAERAGVDTRASTVMVIATALGVPVCALFEKKGGHEHGDRSTKRKATAKTTKRRRPT